MITLLNFYKKNIIEISKETPEKYINNNKTPSP